MSGDTDAPLFTPEGVRSILAAAKPKGLRDIPDGEMAEFADRLKDAASTYFAEAYMQDGPSPSERRKMFRAVETAADGLLTRFNVSSPEHVRDGRSLIKVVPRGLLEGGMAAEATLERGAGFETIAEILRDVRRLRKWATLAQQRVEPEIGQRPARTVDEAKDNLLGSVFWIWADIIEAYPGLSKGADDGRPAGPFVKFALRVFRAIPSLEKTTAGAISGRYERLFRVRRTCSN